MSITDELREYAKGFENVWFKPASMEVTITTGESMSVDHVNVRLFIEGIADRIDAEHQKQVTDAFTKGAVDGIDMAELGWVRKEDGKTVSTCYVDVVPRFDWELMAQELEQFAEIVRGMAGEDA